MGGRVSLVPVDKAKIIAEYNERARKGGHREIDPDSDHALNHLIGRTQRAYHFYVRLIIRWQSPSGVRHQQTRVLPPLGEIVGGEPNYNPERAKADSTE